MGFHGRTLSYSLVALGVVIFSAPTRAGQVPDLRKAIFEGDLRAVRAAATGSSVVNATDAQGWTPLMNAVAYAKGPRVDIVAAILDAGALLEAANSQGETAVIVATKYPRLNAPVVRLLLDRGANANARSRVGKTALIHSAFNLEAEQIQALLDKGASVDAVDEEGDTALLVAAREAYVPPNASSTGDAGREAAILNAIEPLLLKGANPNVKNKAGETPLSVVERWFTITHRPAITDRLRKAGAR